MKNQISFEDGTGLIKEIINFNLGKTFKSKFKLVDSDQIRIFLPNWEKILSSESFLDPFLKRYGIGQIYKPAIACYLEYYRSSHFDIAGKYLRRSIKNSREFKINSMEYKNLLWELLVKERKSRPGIQEDDIKLKIEFPILDVTSHSVHKLFLKAAYNDITEPEQTPRGQIAYTKKYFEKIVQYYIHINNQDNNEYLKNKKVKTRNRYTQREIEGLNDYLSEDPIYEELRSTNFNKILGVVKMMLSRYSQNESQSVDFKQNQEFQNPTVVSSDELQNIVRNTLESLNEFLVGKKSEEKIKKIQGWINQIKHYYSLSEPFDHTVLVYINDRFASKNGTVEHINLQIEMLFRRCYREWAKKIFEELNKNEQLTKSEKRLFILMHIGTPYLNYRTPIFDPLLLKYINFKDLTLLTFLLSSVLKVHKIDEIDLKLINLQLYLSFLKFYAFWLGYIRPKDAERKQNAEYTKRFVADQLMETTNWEEKDLDEFRLKKIEKETEISKYEEIDLKDIEIDSDEPEREMLNLSGHFKSFSVLEEDTSKTEKDKIHYLTISVKKPGVNLKKANNFNLMELWLSDILETHCDAQERVLLNKYLIEGYNYDEIGKELRISGTAVRKRIKKILNRLSEEPELKDILTEM